MENRDSVRTRRSVSILQISSITAIKVMQAQSIPTCEKTQ